MEKIENFDKTIIVKVIIKGEDEHFADVSLDELELLVATAGGEVYCRVIQKKDYIDSATYLGSGKLKELKDLCDENDIKIVVFDDELSPSKISEICKELSNVKVIDRSMLILDIFAKNASSSESKLQIELAQLKYTVPRLYGKGKELSNQGAGIGTRGPGETKLETDKRYVKRRIVALQEKIDEIAKNRNVQRLQREKNNSYEIAIAGYTNAGKSTLMNYLTDAGVLSENKLFATLQTTTRKLILPNNEEVLMTDTVGFIRNLPHQFIEAFKSTLDEVKYADLILLTIDASDSEYLEQIKVTKDIISDIAQKEIPIIFVYNKIDLIDDFSIISKESSNNCVFISAANGDGVDKLLEKIVEIKNKEKNERTYILSYDKANLLDMIYKNGVVNEVNYSNEGIVVKAVTDTAQDNKIKANL